MVEPVWQVEGGSLGGGGAAASPEAELAARVNEMWFLEPGGEPLTFREVFLRSQALENILVGAPHSWPEPSYMNISQHYMKIGTTPVQAGTGYHLFTPCLGTLLC